MTATGVRRWLAEPTLHFLAIGAAVFAAYAWLVPPTGGGAGESVITVPAETVADLRSAFVARTGLSPTTSELQGLIDNQIDEEVLYREALALGLDRHDVVVRRRLVQNMRFLLHDAAAAAEPTEAELAGFVDRHRERYATPSRVSFSHVFLSADRRGATAERDALALRATLGPREAADPGLVAGGDPFMIGHRFRSLTPDQIAGRFGAPFAAALASLPTATWSPPIGSAYGLHLVWIDERLAAEPPRLDGIRDRVRRDLLAERLSGIERRRIGELRQRYTVVIEAEDDATPVKLAAKPDDVRP